MHTAALFPGQGSQAEDLTETLARLRPDLLELANAELGDNALERASESTAYAQPATYCCMSAAPMDEPRSRLTQALTNPVRWRETLVALRAHGVKRFIEVGPGKVLTGLVKRTLDGVETTAAQRLMAGG